MCRGSVFILLYWKGRIIIGYIKQVFWNSVPQWGVRGSEKWKFGKTEDFFWVEVNFYIRTKILVPTLDTNHSVTHRIQAINGCFNSESSLFYSQVNHTAHHEECRCGRPSDQVVDKMDFSCSFFRYNGHKRKNMMLFNFIFHLFLTGVASSVPSVDFLAFRELK